VRATRARQIGILRTSVARNDNEYSVRIGEVCARVGLTARTIRYYEEFGLLNRTGSRTKGAHRYYAETDIARLEELIRLRDLLGLSLEELVELAEAEEAREALRDQWAESATDSERDRIIGDALTLYRRRLALVRSRQKTLDEFADVLSKRVHALQARRSRLRKKARV
jgi:MerR family transcriptional regulator, repressor of the yfmOP operon